MIQRIRIQNFRSLVDVTVELDELTVLIGRSGTGKTNFVRAIRFLRNCLEERALQVRSITDHNSIFHPLHQSATLSYDLKLDIPDVGQVEYRLSVRPGTVDEESFKVNRRVLFRHERGEWDVEPKVLPPLIPNKILLGAIPGMEESTIAYMAIRSGIGCYDFPSSVLQPSSEGQASDHGYNDFGNNFFVVAERLRTDITKLLSWRRVSRSVRAVNSAALGLDLDMLGEHRINVELQLDNNTFVRDVGEESEGFRRYLAHLLALYQTPSKQTLFFEHPDAGIHPGALEALFEEFKACPKERRGQVILTTHSPQLLDNFMPENIRVVDIENQQTRIDRIAPEQVEAIKDGLLLAGELLTVDPARLPGQLAEVPG